MSSQNSSRFFSYIINSVVQGLLPRTKRNRYKIGTPLIDIPTGWDPQAKQQQRAALADFSAAPWQGFEKSERGPNNSSLFQPLAAVVVVAVQVLLSAVTAKEKLPCKTKKTAIKSCLPCGAVKQSKSEPFPSDATSVASPKVTVCVPSL